SPGPITRSPGVSDRELVCTLAAVAFLCASGIALMGLHNPLSGWLLLAGSLGAALLTPGTTRIRFLLVIITFALLDGAQITTDLSDTLMLAMGVVLTLALLIPHAVLRFIARDQALTRAREERRHTLRGEIQCVFAAAILSYLLLPELLLAT